MKNDFSFFTRPFLRIRQPSIFVVQPRALHRADGVVGEEAESTPLVAAGMGLPFRAPLGEDLFDLLGRPAFTGDADDVQLAGKDVQFDQVTFLDQGDRSAVRGFGGAVADDRAGGGT